MMKEKSMKKVLVVDDNNLAQKMLTLMLKSSKFEIVTAHNGYEAIKSFDKSIALVFMDYGMPDMSGAEVVKAIRQKEKDFGQENSVYIVGNSADYSEEISRAFFEAGTNKMMRKPIEPQLLNELIETLNLG